MSDAQPTLAAIRAALDAREADLAEDERIAQAAVDNDLNLEWRVTHDALGQQFTLRTASNRPVLRSRIADSEADEDGIYDPRATFDPFTITEHAARQDPARTLADVERERRYIAGMRKILHEHDPWPTPDGPDCSTCGDVPQVPWPCPTVRLIAESLGIGETT